MRAILFLFVVSIMLFMPVIGVEPTKYDTPDGIITFNLPTGYNMTVDEPYSVDKPFVYDDGWALEATKDGPNEEQRSYILSINAYDADTVEGSEEGNAFAFMVNESLEYNHDKIEGSYTKTTSGQTAWISIGKSEIEGRYNAILDLEADNNKLIQIRSIPYLDSTRPPAGMTTGEFIAFVESIDIE